ncbi:MAG: glycosyltransferase [Bradyrhizobium sp.]|nr:MAG: glycosyltransferase [Bradyrhizobium sp.]
MRSKFMQGGLARLAATANAWRRRIRDSLNIAELRTRARRAALKSPFRAGASAAPAHGLFLYHVENAAVERHFERLVAETQGLVVWRRVFNPKEEARPQTDLNCEHPALLMPRRFASLMQNGGRLQGGLLDVMILPAVLATGASFVWVMEYDVDFAGRWADFFCQFGDSRADFLTASIASYVEWPDWHWWAMTGMPARVRRRRRLRSFNPLMRLSRKFALAYVAALRDPDWRGHYEFTLPTIAGDGGFVVEDLGGMGRLCPPGRRGKNYTATPGNHTFSPGSFVWRPTVSGYFIDQPALFPLKDRLYHPCKTGVADWSVGAADKPDWIERHPRMRIAVVMCTCNGAQYVGEQLSSLTHQTRLPDILIVGDDASNDDTLAIVRAFASSAPFDVELVERPSRLGCSQNFFETARLALARADAILFCDQDDVWRDDKIEIVENAMRMTEALAYSHDLHVDYAAAQRRGPDIPSYFDYLRQLALAPDICCKGCALAVRSAFFEIFGWPPKDSSITHDAWVALLTTALGRRAFIEAPLIRHRIHQRNLSGWITSEEERYQKAPAPAERAFESMLDFYIAEWNRDWAPLLLARLAAVGGDIDAARASSAIEALRRHLVKIDSLNVAAQMAAN